MSDPTWRPAPESAVAPTAGAARRWADLAPRLLSGVVMIALALGTAFVGGHVFALFWLLAALAVYWEWQRLIGARHLRTRLAMGGVTLAVLVGCAQGGAPLLALAALAVGAAAIACVAPGLRFMAAAGLLYAGTLALAVVLLRNAFPGLVAILWLFAVVWGTDIMAYIGGRLIGGPKLAPRLSPSKTWSGFLVGIMSGALAGVAVAPAGGNYGAMMLVGLAAGAVAQGGDVFESRLKRRYGVKDSSNLIPGHGGAMDRLDGFIAATVFALLLGVSRAGLDAAGLGLFNWS